MPTFKAMTSRFPIGLLIMGALYIVVGINHFIHPANYAAIMPRWLPAPAFLVALSGVAEIMLGILLFPLKTRRLAAWGIILLLLAVFPANVQMTLDWHRAQNPQEWIAWLRLPLQAVLIWWAWQYAKRRENS